MRPVTPIFKKGEESDKVNHRPVTILVTLNNIYEKFLASQLDDFYLIIPQPIGNFDCEMALLGMMEDWRSMHDKGEYVAVVSMDLSKAFDVIPHLLLLAKFKASGMDTENCILLKDLSGRLQ